MKIYKDANGMEYTIVEHGEYSKKIYLDEKRPHVDTLIRHKWPEEKPVYDPENPKKYLVLDCTFETASYHPDGYFWTFDCGQEYVLEDVSYWWNLPEVTE